jgi:hypothetical protein
MDATQGHDKSNVGWQEAAREILGEHNVAILLTMANNTDIDLTQKLNVNVERSRAIRNA